MDSYYRYNDSNTHYHQPRKQNSVLQILHWIITLALIVVVCIEGLYIYNLQQIIITQHANVGSNINQVSDTNTDSSRYIGTYYCNDWNGKQSTLTLNANGSGIYPTGNEMTWEYNDGLLHFYINNDEGNRDHVAIPTENGLSLHNTPFFRY